MSGWTKQHRKRFEKAKFQASKQNPFCFGYAFDWLVSNAEYQKNNGLERGQLLVSYRYLAKKWGWTIGKVQRFLVWLVQDQSIKTDTRIGCIGDTPTDTPTDTPKLVVTICNYEKYQGGDTPTDTRMGCIGDTLTDTPTDTIIKEDKEYNNIIISNARARENDPGEKSGEPDDPFKIAQWLTRDCQQFAQQQASRPGIAHIPMAAQWLEDAISYPLDILPTVNGWLGAGYGVGNWIKLSQKIYENYHARKDAENHGNQSKQSAKSDYSKNSKTPGNNRTCGNGFSEYVFAQRARQMGVSDNPSGGSVGDSGNFGGGEPSIIEGVAERVWGNDSRH